MQHSFGELSTATVVSAALWALLLWSGLIWLVRASGAIRHARSSHRGSISRPRRRSRRAAVPPGRLGRVLWLATVAAAGVVHPSAQAAESDPPPQVPPLDRGAGVQTQPRTAEPDRTPAQDLPSPVPSDDGPVPAEQPDHAARASTNDTPRQSGQRDGNTIIVRPGDTLWAIAAERLADDASDAAVEREWRRWYAANRSIIGADPNHILPGQRLTAPAGVDR